MDAEIIAVGSEMLTPQRIDTNSLYLTGQLNALGVEVVQKSIVGDDRIRLTKEISAAISRSRIIILSGGLGPTEDDVTRDAVASALGVRQRHSAEVMAQIEARFQRLKRPMADINKRQAQVIEGADVLPNDRGTAPGQWIQRDGSTIILLPGPPKELMAVFEQQCLPRFQALLPAQYIRSRHLRISGMGESEVDQLIAPIYTRYTNPVTTILAGAGDIQLHLRARCSTCEEADRLLDEVTSQIEPILGDRLYTRTGQLLEESVGCLLQEKKQTVCVAESCTGGLLAQRMTATPGSSNNFYGGFVTYTDDVKMKLLGVDPNLLRIEGAVSEPVAKAMATGARSRMDTTHALSITGFAGPDGGTEANPVGTVYVGLASENGCIAKRFVFSGDRDRIRTLAAQFALDVLRRKLIGKL
ncbi:MAG TPA: competence/damage-inducible protein A [Bryobacteraceae bacterium]|nr:competence/damage-inducible protein A [Bryobacteraceae bacterium]